MPKMNGRYDGDDIRGITADGREVRADDEWFEDTVRQWEHEGIDADLIHMARPLLEGTGKQQRLAERFLSRVRDNYLDDAQAQSRLLSLLRQERVPMGSVPHMTEEQFNSAWDDLAGKPQGNSPANISFGHSDATRREANRGGPQ